MQDLSLLSLQADAFRAAQEFHAAVALLLDSREDSSRVLESVQVKAYSYLTLLQQIERHLSRTGSDPEELARVRNTQVMLMVEINCALLASKTDRSVQGAAGRERRSM